MRRNLNQCRLADVVPPVRMKTIETLREQGVVNPFEVITHTPDGDVTVVAVTGLWFVGGVAKPFTTVGVAKRHPADVPSRKIGNALARARAIEKMLRLRVKGDPDPLAGV